MNEIVRKHYPASRLPADLREGIPEGAEVDLTITVRLPRSRTSIADLVGSGQNVHGDEQEVLDWIRAGREDR
jgi:hypothetical protein